MFENIQSFTVKKASWTEAGMFALLQKYIRYLKTYTCNFNNSFDLIHASVDILNWCIYCYGNFQIEDFVMISAKEAKDLLYTLFSENFITTTVSEHTCTFKEMNIISPFLSCQETLTLIDTQQNSSAS